MCRGADMQFRAISHVPALSASSSDPKSIAQRKDGDSEGGESNEA